MSGAPMSKLAKFAAQLASPDMARRSTWRALIGRDHWVVILIRHAKPGAPPEKPDRGSTIRLSPEWLRSTGAGLTPEQLLHERISQHLRAHTQDEAEVDVARATSIATDAAVSVLAELGVDITSLRTTQEASTDD